MVLSAHLGRSAGLVAFLALALAPGGAHGQEASRVPPGQSATVEIFDEGCLAREAGAIMKEIWDQYNPNQLYGYGLRMLGPLQPKKFWAPSWSDTNYPSQTPVIQCGEYHYYSVDPNTQGPWICKVIPYPLFELEAASKGMDLARIRAAQGKNSCLVTVSAPTNLSADVSASRTVQREMAATLRSIQALIAPGGNSGGAVGGLSPAAGEPPKP